MHAGNSLAGQNAELAGKMAISCPDVQRGGGTQTSPFLSLLDTQLAPGSFAIIGGFNMSLFFCPQSIKDNENLRFSLFSRLKGMTPTCPGQGHIRETS